MISHFGMRRLCCRFCAPSPETNRNLRDDSINRKSGSSAPALKITPEIYASDHPTSVNTINIASAPRLTSDNVLPFPSSKFRVSALQQSTVATIRIAPQEIAHGNPGYCDRVDIVFSEGCPAGSHHGRIGANPAASTKVKILRLIQLLILVTGFALRTLRQT